MHRGGGTGGGMVAERHGAERDFSDMLWGNSRNLQSGLGGPCGMSQLVKRWGFGT